MRLTPLLTGLIVSLGVALTGCRPETRGQREKEEAPTGIIEEVGALPLTVESPASNPLTPDKAELGRLLFYDPILSGSRDVACASCHHPDYGYAESQEISIGVNGTGLGELRSFRHPNDIPFVKRNAHSVLNTAFNGMDAYGNYYPDSAAMFWDNRAKSLENQSLEPIKAFEEMRGHAVEDQIVIDSVIRRLRDIPEYRQRFAEAFGEAESITEANLGKALAAFERTLLANNSRFDQYLRGDKTALSEWELDGYRAFLKAGCAKCHNGSMFSDFQLHVLGVPDNPKLVQTDAGAGNRYAFRTPTLRNLRYTDPYMHNGTSQTLEQVLEFYEDLAGKEPRNPHVTSRQLDPLAKQLKLEFKDIRPIIEFLNTLNDDQFDRKVPAKVPSGLPVGGNIGSL